jgi:hypothetical protein
MNKSEFVQSLKVKSVNALFELLKFGNTGSSQIAQDYVLEIISELKSRELSKAESIIFENLVEKTHIEKTHIEKTPVSVVSDFQEKLIEKTSEYSRYTALKTISGLLSILGYILIVVGFVSMFYFFNNNKTFIGIAAIISSIIISLPMIVFSGLVTVFIDIEQNTRKTNEALNNSK